LTCR